MEYTSQSSKQRELRVGVPPNLQAFPNEPLTMVLKNLAFQDVDEYPGTETQYAIEEAYKDLRNLCLVSKTIEAVARPILFENTMDFRCTNLVALYRTLLCNERLGRYIKHLALNAVFRWYRPGKRPPNYSRLPLSSLEGLDADLDCWQDYWRKPRAAAYIQYGVIFIFGNAYFPFTTQYVALQVLEDLLPLCGWHLPSLEEITYSYSGDSAKVEDGTSCTCVEERVRCNYHLRVWKLSLSASSMGIPKKSLSRFKALVDQSAEQSVHLKEEDMMGEGVDGCEADDDNPIFRS
ncbi:hypothetical protein VMCG_07247 [Cytospora schulzeri]|uniref:Uncharacterized protein n=1 Tax=Cytospora schulzeri TaxID=448051 RepID=A0A423WAI0_9PEZI|nr:hypothetical protein VMCG_07247 [Valsa malicola]